MAMMLRLAKLPEGKERELQSKTRKGKRNYPIIRNNCNGAADMKKREKTRSQSEIIKELAGKYGLSLAQTKQFINSFAEVMANDLKTYGTVIIPHLGKLKTRVRAAHQGRNPRTGSMVEVKAKTVVIFKAKKELISRLDARKSQAA